MKRRLLFLAALAASPAAAYSPGYNCTENYYLDAVNGADTPTCGTAPGSGACKTIEYFNTQRNPAQPGGTCVNFAAGVYSNSSSYQTIWPGGGTARGPNDASGYVAWVGAANHASILAWDGNANDCNNFLDLGHSYIILDGFEIKGDVTGAHACSSNYAINTTVSGTDHFMVINNLVHGFGGGVGATYTDWLIVANNQFYNNDNQYFSGASIFQPSSVAPGPGAWDQQTYHIQFLYNVSHDNGGYGSCPPGNPNCHTDGNGLIFDQFGPANYSYAALMQSNVAYHNGGSGIRVVWNQISGNSIMVDHNTLYDNFTDPLNNATIRGNMDNGFANNVTWQNNISRAVPGSGTLLNNEDFGWYDDKTTTGTTFIYNETYGGTKGNCGQNIEISGTGNDTGNCTTIKSSASHNLLGKSPVWKNSAIDDFHLTATSPGLNKGSLWATVVLPVPGNSSLLTQDGATQASTGATDIGAFCQSAGCP